MKIRVEIVYYDGKRIFRDFLCPHIAEDAKKSLEDMKLRYPGTVKDVTSCVIQ